jgi:hypothetical protein
VRSFRGQPARGRLKSFTRTPHHFVVSKPINAHFVPIYKPDFPAVYYPGKTGAQASGLKAMISMSKLAQNSRAIHVL